MGRQDRCIGVALVFNAAIFHATARQHCLELLFEISHGVNKTLAVVRSPWLGALRSCTGRTPAVKLRSGPRGRDPVSRTGAEEATDTLLVWAICAMLCSLQLILGSESTNT